MVFRTIINRDKDERSTTSRVNESRKRSVEIAELIGLCKGVLADGAVNISEAEFILSWLESKPETSNLWPADELHKLLLIVLEDGKLSDQEETALLDLLLAITGVQVTIEYKDTKKTQQSSTSLPINDDCEVGPEGAYFCLTGTFESGTRAECEARTQAAGGTTQKGPTKKTDYLVIGNIGNEDWAHSSFGRKIEKAVALQKSGSEIEIISESLWNEYID